MPFSRTVNPQKKARLDTKPFNRDQQVLWNRWKYLANFDVWLPLTLDAHFFEKNKHLPSLHGIMGLGLAKFKAIVNSHRNLWVTKNWTDFFRRFNFEHTVGC